MDGTRRDFLKMAGTTLAAAAALDPAALAQSAAERPSRKQRDAQGAVSVFVTAGDKRHASAASLNWRPLAQPSPSDIVLNSSAAKQEVLGFGAALTDAACYMIQQLPPEPRAKLLHELYHPSAMNFSVGRTCIGSSDYSTVAYSYDDSPSPDPQLTRFSIDHDKKWILPTLREVRQANPSVFLLSSPWSPPGWMKDNNSLLGGTIHRQFLKPYADYFVRFIQSYAAEGFAIDAVTSQNEVDTDQDGRMPQCTWPQEVEVKFVGEELGPAFEKAGIKTRIWLIDHNYNLWGRALAELEDDNVRKYADGIAWHGYLGTPQAMSRVHDAYPDKHAYWTEGGPDITDPKYLTNWSIWGQTFTGVLRNWGRAIIAWNVALDEKGKPNIGPFPCGGVVTINRQTKEITRSGQYWAFAHFSQHVQRGARVIDSGSDGKTASHVAFTNPDGSRVVVLTNDRKTPAIVCVTEDSQCVQVELPAESVTTLRWA